MCKEARSYLERSIDRLGARTGTRFLRVTLLTLFSSWLLFSLLLHVFFHVHSEFRAIDISRRIRGNSFGYCGLSGGRIGPRVGHKVFYQAVLGATDANAPLTAWVVSVALLAAAGFRISDVQHIIPVNEDSARAAELFPLGNETAVLVKDLDAVILAIAHEKASPRVECQSMRTVEFACPRHLLSPGFHELPVPIEFHDPGVGGGGTAVAVGNKDVAVGSYGNLGRLIKCV